MAVTEQSPSTKEQTDLDKVLRIRLKVIDRETGESRYCTVAETETWNWANPEYWRIIGGWQITSYQRLLNLLYLKVEKGVEEVAIVEGPRFTMLSGG
ncbi:MAG: hypothetical protein A4E65_03751 [Syntrophorhabdus sp. PtaU1.Bin153]|nr:MAG: hypothetical protein A4E65_03751 [Syntrophorhabdus sp. PtaU1.Bin153]